jgi:predicted flap endonuclease-1-like 5' DNA nuclease
VLHSSDGDAPASVPAQPRPEAARLQAALEALAARDQVLADRNRRLAALEDAAARLTVLAGRLETTEQELAALRRACLAQAADREARIADLERRLFGGSSPARLAPLFVETEVAEEPAPTAGPPEAADVVGHLARLERDLELERQRNLRLTARGREANAAESAGLQQALDDCRQRSALLARRLAVIEQNGGAGPGDAYARWEQWFRKRAAERHDSDLQRAEETVRLQHSVLKEKEQLIATLLGRLRAVGEAHDGPDDLKQIVGIGPVIEELLHGLGITTFEQLASLSAEEADRIGDLLGAFRERIRRDGWAEQAAELARRRVRIGSDVSLG